MTDCNAETLRFASLGRKAVLADFRGGRLTTDAGLLLLRELEGRLGLFDALDQAIPDPRLPELITHEQRALLAQRIVAMACGYEDLNDHLTLRDDPALQLAAGVDPDAAPPLALPATLCRLENRVDRATLVRIAAVLVDQFLAAHPEPPEHLMLGVDATDDPVHGHQEGRFFHGYYDHPCFLPLYVFCGDELLAAYLRPANIDGARHARALFKLLVDRLRTAWPRVKITIRADSGFCRWRLMRWCDSNGVGYILGLAKNPALQRAAIDWTERAERQFERTGEPQRLFGSFAYAAASWDRPRRVIVKAEHTARGANPRFVVTNVPGDPRDLYEAVYCQRGEAENRIKEQLEVAMAEEAAGEVHGLEGDERWVRQARAWDERGVQAVQLRVFRGVGMQLEGAVAEIVSREIGRRKRHRLARGEGAGHRRIGDGRRIPMNDGEDLVARAGGRAGDRDGLDGPAAIPTVPEVAVSGDEGSGPPVGFPAPHPERPCES